MGGKTGTGDELIERYGPGPGTGAGRRKEVSRSAAFAFFLGERFFGVITAHVPGVNEEGHRFTGALPTQVLKALDPVLRPTLRDKPSRPMQWEQTSGRDSSCANRCSGDCSQAGTEPRFWPVCEGRGVYPTERPASSFSTSSWRRPSPSSNDWRDA